MRLTSKVLHLSAHIETVLLDMDGTLLDLHFDDQVWNYTLTARLAVVHGESVIAARARVAATLGDVRGSLNWYCLDHWTATFGISIHALEEELAHLVAIRDGTLLFLEFLRQRGYRSVLATNAHPASLARKLQLTGLAGSNCSRTRRSDQNPKSSFGRPKVCALTMLEKYPASPVNCSLRARLAGCALVASTLR